MLKAKTLKGKKGNDNGADEEDAAKQTTLPNLLKFGLKLCGSI